MTTNLVNLLKKVKKQKQPETLALEILREYKYKLRIALAINFILCAAIIFAINQQKVRY